MRINKRGKRIFAGLALVLAVTTMTAVPARAENQNNYQTNVTYTVPDKYKIKIPTSVTFSGDDEGIAQISAEEMNIASNKELRVTVSGGITGGKVTLQNGATNSIQALVTLDSGGTTGIGNNEVVAKFKGTSTDPEAGGILYFRVSNYADAAAGEYTGTITFEVTIV